MIYGKAANLIFAAFHFNTVLKNILHLPLTNLGDAEKIPS